SCSSPCFQKWVMWPSGPSGRAAPCRLADLWRHDRKPRPAMEGGAHVDAVSEKIGGLANDEQADAKAIASFRVEASKRFEQAWHSCVDDPDPGIEHVDSHARSEATATEKYPPTGIGVLDGVAHQVAENNAEQQRIAENGCSRPHYTNADLFPRGSFQALTTGLPQQGGDTNGAELNFPGAVMKKKSAQQIPELLVDAVYRGLTQLEQLQFGFGTNA